MRMVDSSARLNAFRNRTKALGRLNAFISYTSEASARTVVAVKDVVEVRGVPTTAGGRILPGQPAADDAPVIKAIRRHGCMVIGKTNMHEWAFGSTGINPHYGTTRNPHDENRVAGGSSGGSAVAVAAGLCDWAMGSDTGGSIRIPASMSGVVGLKPTTGLVSTRGTWPLSQSLDTIGPIGPNVVTVGQALEMMTDAIGSMPSTAPRRETLRLATPEGWDVDLDEDTDRAWRKVRSDFPYVRFPTIRTMTKACLTIMYSEAGAFHRVWLLESPEKYGPDILARLRSTFEVTGPDLVDALRARESLVEEVDRTLENLDALILPTTGCVAPLVDSEINTEPFARLTRPFNLSGHPVVSIPLPVEGLPVGVQFVGHRGGDWELLRIALAFEEEWGPMKPPSLALTSSVHS